MFQRDPFVRAQLPRSHFFVTIARGEGMWTFALRPHAVWSLAAVVPLVLIWAFAATAYIAFHDDMLAAYLIHEARMQNAYEDRIAEARAELDRVASRQLLDQNSFEGRMHDLLSRQARIEQHDKIIEALTTQAVGHEAATDSHARAATKPSPDTQAADPLLRQIPTESGGTPSPASKPASGEESGDSLSLNAPLDNQDTRATALAVAASDRDLDATARLGLLAFSIDRVERNQISLLAGITQKASNDSSRISALVARTGLSHDQLSAPAAKDGVGGPFVPADPGPAAPAFDKAFAHAAKEVDRAYRLRRLVAYMPVREPLIGDSSVSSPFGYRPDPFIGRPALHPGVDLVQPYGAPIKATAAGRVTHAGSMGGYGEMVEIDHGNGIATRYGHMSEVLVEEGAIVKAGETLGRIGSTGRSTGPHLHYEVRIDGEPVDPERFLDAGADFFEAKTL